jgi:hypothetical protein
MSGFQRLSEPLESRTLSWKRQTVILLTSQEKKVLGFILFLLVFGLAVTAYRKIFEAPRAPLAGQPATPKERKIP